MESLEQEVRRLICESLSAFDKLCTQLEQVPGPVDPDSNGSSAADGMSLASVENQKARFEPWADDVGATPSAGATSGSLKDDLGFAIASFKITTWVHVARLLTDLIQHLNNGM